MRSLFPSIALLALVWLCSSAEVLAANAKVTVPTLSPSDHSATAGAPPVEPGVSPPPAAGTSPAESDASHPVTPAEADFCKITASEIEKGAKEHPSLDLRLRTPLIPSDQPIVLDIFGPETVMTEDVQFRAAYNLSKIGDLGVISWKKAEGNASNRVLTLDPIHVDWNAIFPRIHVYVLACDKGRKLLTYGSIPAPVSVGLQASVLAVAVTVLAYVLCALGYAKINPRSKPLSPIWLARDFTGRASLSQMQIIFFSVIVLFLVTYILLRTGVLADLSEYVLALLGIAGVGSVAGKIGTYNTDRLDFANMAWAVRKQWISNAAGWQVAEPKMSDLVTTAGEFDPYKFQMVAFSAVVGIALFIIGVNGLADFAIPPALLGVIGLSQATYVSGKVFGTGSMKELNKKLSDLREIEASFLQKSAAAWQQATPLDAAIALDQVGHMAFKTAVGPAWTMFSELIQQHTNTPNLNPSP